MKRRATSAATAPPAKHARGGGTCFTVAGVPFDGAGPRHPLPERGRDGCFQFPDFPDFRPNLSPEEVLRAGAFGGTYFRSITSTVAKCRFPATVHREFPPSWFAGIDTSRLVTAAQYDASVNRYEVKSGNDLAFWEGKGWMRPCDPYGWFQWYCRFWLGRRVEDDARQVSRWVKAIGPKGRWRTFLVGQCVRASKEWNDATASPVTRQTLLHWGYELTETEFERLAGPIRRGKSVIYMGKVAPAKAKRQKQACKR